MMTDSQIAAFTNATSGISAAQFQLTILLIFYSVVYLWSGWVVTTQWKAWGNRKISFYDFLSRTTRCVLIVLLSSFFLL